MTIERRTSGDRVRATQRELATRAARGNQFARKQIGDRERLLKEFQQGNLYLETGPENGKRPRLVVMPLFDSSMKNEQG